MFKQTASTKRRPTLAAAAIGAGLLALAALPGTASAFGFHGGMGHGMGGGFRSGMGGGFHAVHSSGPVGGGFNSGLRRPAPFHPPGGGRIVTRLPGGHLPGGHLPGGHRPGGHWPPPMHGCHGFKCGPIFVPPVLIATVGTVAVGYYYGDQPIYYRDKLVRAAPTCAGPIGTFALISFVPTATAADIATFLQSYKTAISDGPNEDAVYVIKLADRRMSEPEVREELTSMQAQTSVVRLIGQQDATATR